MLLTECPKCFRGRIPDRYVVLGFAVALDYLRSEADLASSAYEQLQAVMKPNAEGVQQPASLQIVNSRLEHWPTRGRLLAC